jgi:hypothetical protein
MSKARDLANAGTALSAVSATELAYLDGVTSAVQTQIDGKQAVNAAVSTTELGYLDGVTSAIQTQLDAKTAKSTLTTTGDIYYASAANTPARLGIGSTDQVLKVTAGIPAWATPASAGSMTLLSTTSLTGSSVTVSSISGAYNTLRIELRDFRTSEDDRTINLRFNGDTGTNYGVCTIHMNVGTLTGSAANVTSLFVAKSNISSTALNLGQASIEVPLYASTSYNKFEQHWYGSRNPGGIQSGAGVGRYASTSAITSVTLFSDAGTFDAGTMLIYGVN